MWMKKPCQDHVLIFLVVNQEIIFEKEVMDKEKAENFLNNVNTFERNYHEM